MTRPSRRTTTLLAAAAVALAATPGLAGPPGTHVETSWVDREVARILPHVHNPLAPHGPGNGDTGVVRSRYSYAIPRAEADRPDTQDGRLVHVIYFLPADKPDEALDTSGVIDVSIAAQNAWMARESGGLRWRFDTFDFDTAEGRKTAYDVTFVRSTKTSAELHDITTIDAELIDTGHVQDGKRYLIYAAVDGAGACGSAYYPLSQPTDVNADGQFAGVYLDAVEGCASRDFASSVDSPGMTETIAQQEIMHNDGIAPLSSLHQCLPGYFHVCTAGLAEVILDPERFDVLFPYVGVPLREKKLDIGHDDYYQALVTIRDVGDSPFLTRD